METCVRDITIHILDGEAIKLYNCTDIYEGKGESIGFETKDGKEVLINKNQYSKIELGKKEWL